MLKANSLSLHTLFILMIILWLYAPTSLMGQNSQSTSTPQPTPTSHPTPIDCETIKKTDLNLSKSPNFVEITNLRDEINSEASRLDQRATELNKQISLSPSEDQLKARRKMRKDLEDKPKKTDEDEFRLMELDTDVPSKESLTQELKTTREALAVKKAQLRCIQQTIADINTPEQGFKQTMSIIFAILIGAVILGFFVLSYVDESIRRAIFSGQTGIQFLTLFSIVIAIILFGITGILQDKELAALLGGLSGYILGRYSSSGQSSAATDATPPTNPTVKANP
ncbi:MAG: hypothetical protein QOC96_2960 [Acidobacteriota bacterium]|nr:hypothetical protein [Acidobacteriota bacterium]